MSSRLPKPVEDLAESLASLPGIGPKMASRLAIYLATSESNTPDILSESLKRISKEIRQCSQCNHLSTENICSICADEQRQNDTVMVLETAVDLIQVEQSGVYEGRYFVLGNLISPANGIGADDIHINKLINYIKEISAEEVILALSSTVEGEATSIYLQDVLSEEVPKIKSSKLARGLPTGVNIEYLDRDTIAGALQGRT